MDSNNNIQLGDLQKIQKSINRIVSNIGIEDAAIMFEKISNNTSLDVSELEKVKFITGFIVSRSITIFNLKEDRFMTSIIPEYRQARMACFHLIYTYTEISYPKIGELFGRNRRSVMYYFNECSDRLSVPIGHREFVEKYNLLKKHTLEFIGKLN
jgi:chromosomal replication initiation ATPase DnaA